MSARAGLESRCYLLNQMDIPKYVGVLYGPLEDGSPDWWSVRSGNDEDAVKADILEAYQRCVATNRADGKPESFIEQIGWDVYVSTRASANAPDAVHHPFEGPGVTSA